jgi:hypothetical protein
MRWEIGQRLDPMFGKGMDLKKWTSTVANLIDVKEKIRMFCIKK